jgi:cell division protease FtsH
MGPEKKSKVISKREKETTAFHESGHALLSLLLPDVDPMTKVSIIPRGMAGGYTLIPPTEDRHLYTKKELMSRLVVSLGGRAAEELHFGEITTGAQDDLEKVTEVAKRMVCDFGMSERLGNVTFGRSHGPVFLGRDLVEEKDYSEETARIIDEEVKRIVDESYAQAKKLIKQKIVELKLLADELLEKEVLDGEVVKKIVGIEKKQEQQV